MWNIYRLVLVLFEATSASTYVTSEYVGCVLDSDDRTIPYEKMFSNLQTNRRCAAYCCAMGNYTYTGTEVHWECYCGNDSSRTFQIYPDTECSTNCHGNQNEKCGGYWRLSVYKIECPNTIPVGDKDDTSTLSSDKTTEIKPVITTETPKMSLDEVLDRIAEIKKEIYVNVRDTSAYKNSKISAPDDRMSSKSIGIVGLIFVLFPVLIMTIGDFLTCFTKSPVRKDTRKNKSKRQKTNSIDY